jgi:hypothetical protein
MKFNDLEINNWKESDVNVESLWHIEQRDKSGKHSNIYHGNFIPQIPYQLIKRYTKKNDTVLDMFLGSGTSLYEAEKLNRCFIGLDINGEILAHVSKQMANSKMEKFVIAECDSSNSKKFESTINRIFLNWNINNVQFTIMHPPYMDIVKFTDKKEDLSNTLEVDSFIKRFLLVVKNGLKYLETDRYFAVVIGDIYKNSEVVPLSFYVMDAIKKNFSVKLKGIVVKNIEGNRGKQGQGGIWRYRALKSDYYIFKHEYIFIFKKLK